ncbi:polysaccharide biosynthesis/export family protein [Bacteroides fluxus]|jgi:polysaccharide export outer membrane protein|uniref:Polysaccharide biosynthesis/export protein n=1 Tax=Bacteroides fluxus YIT 12057 TaxID=763034 RepID=F3PWC0_9BACE|nr:polysaccharide biosynthesis/export family protein [Bacteroides fluxus]EGF52469.1 polysaccharide biosynthesis/export protein [Bacteroides fluxus YIT 12057]MDY3790056.1 polysaccharide biosynthesis/export family protein [Bacteroides fluxus]
MKKRSIIILLATAMLASCQSYKKVPYLQDNPVISTEHHETTSLYDARIMPKDLLTIVVSCPEEPELAEPFNLTVSTPVSNTGNKSLTSQPALQQYLVDNQGNIDFPVLGTIHLGGLTKGEAEQLVKDKLAPQFHRAPIVTVRMVNYKISVIGEVASPGTFTISNEKVNLFEALAMAGDMTIYGIRDNVKLIREDNAGKREIITLNLNDTDILQSPYYYLQQNDIVYVTPNKTKAKTSNISTSTTIWFSVVGSLVSLASLIIAITK